MKYSAHRLKKICCYGLKNLHELLELPGGCDPLSLCTCGLFLLYSIGMIKVTWLSSYLVCFLLLGFAFLFCYRKNYVGFHIHAFSMVAKPRVLTVLSGNIWSGSHMYFIYDISFHLSQSFYGASFEQEERCIFIRV